MKRILPVLFLAFLFIVGIVGFLQADTNLVKIGVLAKRGPERCLQKWSLTADYLTQRIPGRKFIIVPLDHDQLYVSVKNQEIDFILANPAYYVPFEKLYGAKRITTLKNLVVDEVTTLYGGVVFTRANRIDIRHLEDLEDKSFMAVDKSSFGGWITFWRELNARKIDYKRYFSEFRFGATGTHDEVVYAVRDGRVDAGTVRTDTLERMQAEGKINMSDFYVIKIYEDEHQQFPFVCSTRVYPEWPFAEAATTSDELAEAVALALLQMPSDSPAAVAATSAGWTIPMNYQSVHECLRELKIDPYKDIGKITFKDVLKKYWYGILLTVILFLMMGGFLIVIFNLNRNLKLSNEQLNASYVALKDEIEERKLTEKKLIKAKKDAEAATRAKSEFLANMSHEIRTPMNGVIASAELALSEELPNRTKLTFHVKDTGIGISPDFLPNLFKPFTQEDSSSTRKYGGAGLGLSICKQLVDIMNGQIWAESKLGEGSTFYFTIDIETQAEEEKQIYIFPPELQNMNVLVVDDNFESLLVMQNMLKSFGFYVKSADSGQKALELIKTQSDQAIPFQLIIMDYYMPDLDGIETSRQIRQELRLSTPIILMTTFGREIAKTKAQQVGINGFLTKPLYPSTLFDAIINLLRKTISGVAETEKLTTTEVSIYKERLQGTRVLVAEDNQTNREIAIAILEGVGPAEPAGEIEPQAAAVRETAGPPEHERKIDIDKIVPLFIKLADAIDIADPEAIHEQMNAVKEHLNHIMLMDLEDQLNDYEYEEASETLKEIAQNLGFCLISVVKK